MQKCDFELVEKTPGGWLFKCRRCGWVHESYKVSDPAKIWASCLPTAGAPGRSASGPPAERPRCASPAGPGHEFGLLVKKLGARPKIGCRCAAIQREMNQLGPAGCREQRERLVEELRANYLEHYNTWADKLRAYLAAAAHPALALSVGTSDPLAAIGILFDLAVAAAEPQVFSLSPPGPP